MKSATTWLESLIGSARGSRAGLDRRSFLAVGGVGGLLAATGLAPALRGAPAGGQPGDDIYTRMFGIAPVIGAAGPLSSYGNSRIPAEVRAAMEEANRHFVDLEELNRAAGRRIAEIMGAEAAMATASATGAMLLGAAACLTGTDRERADALPHPTWPEQECLIQRPHRFLYDRAYRAAGMKIVEVDTREEMVAAINERTAMIAGLGALDGGRRPDVLQPAELVEIGRAAGVPVLIDAAGELPPVSNLRRFTGMGGDLVAISGGKALGAPASTGILAGRRDLIEAALLNSMPNQNIGRGMKVGRDEIVGLVVALERYLVLDHGALFAEWERKSRYIVDALDGVPGVHATLGRSSKGFATAQMTWDTDRFPVTVREFGQAMRSGHPRIVLWTFLGSEQAVVNPTELEDGDEVLIAERVREFFLNA